MKLAFVHGGEDAGQTSVHVFFFREAMYLRIPVGAMVVKLCKLFRAVGLRVLVTILHVLFSSVSMIFVWRERDHTGAQYSALE